MQDNGNVWRKYRVVPRAYPSHPLICAYFHRAGNKERFRLPGAGGGSFPLYGGTFARSYSVSKTSCSLALRFRICLANTTFRRSNVSTFHVATTAKHLKLVPFSSFGTLSHSLTSSPCVPRLVRCSLSGLGPLLHEWHHGICVMFSVGN